MTRSSRSSITFVTGRPTASSICVQPALGLLVVDALTSRVGHLADLARELIPQARGVVAGRAERILGIGCGQVCLAHADCRRQVRQLVDRSGTFDVVVRDPASGRDDDRAVVILDVAAGALTEEGILGLGTFRCGLRAGGGLTRRGLGLVADIGEGTADTAPLLLEQRGRLGMDVGDILADPHELLDGNVSRPLRRIGEHPAG